MDTQVQKFLYAFKKRYGQTMCFAKRSDHHSFSLGQVKMTLSDLNNFFDFYWIDVPKMIIYVPVKQPRTSIIQSDMVVKKATIQETINHILEYNKFKFFIKMYSKDDSLQFKIVSGKFESKLDMALETVIEYFPNYDIKTEFRVKSIVLHVVRKRK